MIAFAIVLALAAIAIPADDLVVGRAAAVVCEIDDVQCRVRQLQCVIRSIIHGGLCPA